VRGRPEEARALLDEGLELSLATHNTRNVTLCLTVFAQLAFVQGEGERAALLAGAAEGLRQRVGLQAWPLEREGGAQMVAQVRQAVGADRFDRDFAAGLRLNRQEAIAAVRDPQHRHRSLLRSDPGAFPASGAQRYGWKELVRRKERLLEPSRPAQGRSAMAWAWPCLPCLVTW
jgi:hypothetical protein